MQTADRLLQHYLAGVEIDLGTGETTNAQLNDYLLQHLGPELFGRVGEAEETVAEFRTKAPTIMEEVDQYPNEAWSRAINKSANALQGLIANYVEDVGLPLARQRLAYQKVQETYGGDDADLDDRVDWDVKAAQGGQSGTRDVEFMRAMAAERAQT